MNLTKEIIIDESSIHLDPFDGLRVSHAATIFDSKQLQDKQPLFWDDVLVSGSGGASTYNANQASTTLSVANTTACRRLRQTKRRFNYQPGKGQRIQLTGVFGEYVGNIKRIGYYDDNNGLFFQQDENGIGVGIRTKTSGVAVDTVYYQEDWSEAKLEGNESTKIVLDVTKTQIFHIDFEWLGVGSVRFGIVFNGILRYIHRVHNANILDVVYMSLPNLPLRYEIINNGTGSADTLTHICSTVQSEGGVDKSGITFGINRGSTALSTNNNANIYSLIAVKLKSSYVSSTVSIDNISVVCSSTAAYAWYLLLNPTITGTALTYSDITNTSVSASTTATNATTLSGGTILATGVSQSSNDSALLIQNPNDYRLGSTYAGVSDVIVLAIQRLTGTSETFYASLTLLDQQ